MSFVTRTHCSSTRKTHFLNAKALSKASISLQDLYAPARRFKWNFRILSGLPQLTSSLYIPLACSVLTTNWDTRPFPRNDTNDHNASIFEAITFFIQTAKPTKLGHVSNRVDLGDSPWDDSNRRSRLIRVLDAVAKLPRVVLQAQLEIIDTSWRLCESYWTGPALLDSYTSQSFLAVGRNFAAEMSKERAGTERKWRLCPDTNGVSREQAKRELIATGHMEAARWVNEGL